MSKPLVAANCCVTVVESSGYVPKGRFEDHAELGYKIYRTGEESGKVVLIDIYDIWGYSKSNNNYAQVADTIATATGFPVIIPDVFHGAVFTREIFASGKIGEWVAANGSWDRVKVDLEKLIDWSKANLGAEKFGIFGFCYGGKIVVKSLAELLPPILAGATFHPSFLQIEDAEPIKGPLCLLPSKDEAEIISTDFLATLKAKSFGDRVVHRRFSDMHHGWNGTGGDFTNPLNKQRAEEAMTLVVDFFSKEFAQGSAPAVL
ncbi:alpha/beta-hydrolase [Gonapodya prolifera JEL478]|uniref:Alpha/beta-hydrolase n=1 Tax=Gonapodya prolifera (strain JEL478) TaxID=1344416 RepID=A0A139AT80_GONPJ|nr:alpha/beta-hydrolase [Gonapodya prolifera JEL478]|eukprot:KXS19931.1 alpha/beta-hydrolase [Gonapodya prolifera JEL478]